MNNYYISLLTLVLLLTACGQSTQSFEVDGTQPVSDENRVIYQMNVGAFTQEGTFQAAMKQLDRLDTLGIDIIWLMPIRHSWLVLTNSASKSGSTGFQIMWLKRILGLRLIPTISPRMPRDR